jgi:hypothetical protein
MERDYRDAPAHRFARDIADAMGKDWQYDGEDVRSRRVGYIAGPKGARIGIILDPWYDDPERERSKYRVEVIGCYARLFRDELRPHKHEAPQMTCAPSRGAEAIARDISNRCLPDYWPALNESHEAASRYEREFYTMLDGMGVLSETLEARLNPDLSIWGSHSMHWSGRDAHATVEWHGPYGISIDIH